MKRTLVKSGPELWAEVSDAGALARLLAPFGSIRIARAEPETLVAWEGERASGRLMLEPSGFGTKVTIEATIATVPREGVRPLPSPPPSVSPEPEPEPEPEAPARRSLWARMFRRSRPVEAVAPAPGPEPVVEPEQPPLGDPAMTDEAALLVLTDTLEALGTARHRPFSRV